MRSQYNHEDGVSYTSRTQFEEIQKAVMRDKNCSLLHNLKKGIENNLITQDKVNAAKMAVLEKYKNVVPSDDEMINACVLAILNTLNATIA
jgi:hypothetical protein